MKTLYHINDNLIIGTIKAKGLTVSEFCRDIGISRQRFYEVMKKGFKSKNSWTVQRIAENLDLDESLIWIGLEYVW